MSGAPIPRNHRSVSASKLLEVLGKDLTQIKSEDELTWADVGRVLGKGRDAVADYGDAFAEMPVTAYLFGRREWGTRFTARVEALVDADRDRGCDTAVLPSILECARGIAEAARDGRICEHDVHTNRKDIEEAISALQGLLQKLDGEG